MNVCVCVCAVGIQAHCYRTKKRAVLIISGRSRYHSQTTDGLSWQFYYRRIHSLLTDRTAGITQQIVPFYTR